jgi:hypothetical protein
MLDFEAAAWQACKEIFPGVKPVGCSFHLNQPFYRNIKQIGLAPLYRRDKDIRKVCRKLLSLYHLPHNKIEGRFNYIKENTTNDLALRFCCYIENNPIVFLKVVEEETSFDVSKLFQMKFARIILDDAFAIMDPVSEISEQVCMLRGDRR